MSLEQAIEENTAAIRELIAIMGKPQQVSNIAGIHEVPVRYLNEQVPAKEEPEAKKPTPAPTAEPVSSPPVAEPVTEVIAQEQPLPSTVDLMKDVVPVFLNLCKAKGREAGAAVLAKWNVEKITKVPADQLGEVLAEIQRVAA